MLLNLHVKNLALIKDVDVDFKNGLIVLTGETGAGKSLILGSVNIALGNKTSKELIRTGADYALVELTFSVDDACAAKLNEMDIYTEDENIVVITRKITEARSIAKINGETVNLNTLKTVMACLVDIHGQHDHQSLLYTGNHMSILDKFAHNEIKELLIQLKDKYCQYKQLNNKLEHSDMDEAKRAREIEFAQYEVNEIDAAKLLQNEDIELEEEFKKLSNAKDIVSSLSFVYNAVSDETHESAGAVLSRAIQEMSRISGLDRRIDEFQNVLYNIDSMCRELSSEIYEYNRDMEIDSEYISQVEERLNVVNHLKLKYGQTINDIILYRDEKQRYLDELNNYDKEMSRLRTEITKLEEQLNDLCIKISDIRKKYALKLEQLIKKSLIDLNFISVDFKIKIEKNNKISENGYDNIEFLISTNPGEPIKPLSKVASGGELSRIMLAIKSILAYEDDIDTLIFDEIDTGISGKTAQMVAEKLAVISKNHQVICISHLSQIAAMADSHYLIEKSVDDNSTTTNVKKLDRENSIKELVRINGGTVITDAALTHATEMKEMADRTKCNLV